MLTDVLFIDRGRIVLDCSMDDVELRYTELMVGPDNVRAARELAPFSERQVFGRSVLLYDGVPRERLASLGEARTPSVADLFVAKVSMPGGVAA